MFLSVFIIHLYVYLSPFYPQSWKEKNGTTNPHPSPPPQKKLRIKTHENQKRATFPSSGDLGFPFILSKIVILEGIKHDSKPPVAPPFPPRHIPQFKDEAR